MAVITSGFRSTRYIWAAIVLTGMGLYYVVRRVLAPPASHPASPTTRHRVSRMPAAGGISVYVYVVGKLTDDIRSREFSHTARDFQSPPPHLRAAAATTERGRLRRISGGAFTD